MNRLLLNSCRSSTSLVTSLSGVSLSFRGFCNRYQVNVDAFKSAYNPTQVEENKYQWWSSKGYFKPVRDTTAKNDDKITKFSMVLPPPNVTGSLHIGHALTTTIEDAITRYKRMMGYDTIWVPGLDHSGIATQVAVEKELMAKQKLTRYDLGREEFLKEVFKWTDKYSNNINTQLKKTGSSLEWDRSVFTLDEKRAHAVETAFLTLYNRGLIYRSTRLVNWCPQLQSVISDIEVDHIQIDKPTQYKLKSQPRSHEFGIIHDIRYLVCEEDGGGELVVSTTRVETIFGDTAIAVHPKDDRYKHLIGKRVVNPFTGKLMPIVGDEVLVDMTLGTGAVKVTPAHDFNDYQCSVRNNLERINILNADGTLNQVCGEFQGTDRIMARFKVVESLKAKGLYIAKRPHPTVLAVCSRSGDLLEPVLKPQWYVNCKDMANRGVQMAKQGKLKFVPESFNNDWYRWLENIQDWCISRQLWWGNPIPAYQVLNIDEQYVDGFGSDRQERWVVGRTEKEATEEAIKKYSLKEGTFKLHKDQDVLDTWFSSSLFPMSALGWPDKSSLDLSRYYPLDILETGSDILFFWVARMVMMCSELMSNDPATGGDGMEPPFKTVLLHPLIRDSQGRKMSKSLGNVIDPLHVINGIELDQLKANVLDSNLSESEKKVAVKGLEKEFPKGIPQCGTDALRIGLSQFPINGKDINLDISRIIGQRLFCNKIWNATKLVLQLIEIEEKGFEGMQKKLNQQLPIYYHDNNNNKTSVLPFDIQSLSIADRWILHKLNRLVETVDQAFQTLNLSLASQELYQFFQYDYCDYYLELAKTSVYNVERRNSEQNKNTPLVMLSVLETFLRLNHPFMPYLTEDLWQRLPRPSGSKESIMISQFPSPSTYSAHNQLENQSIDSTFQIIQTIISKVRSIRKQSNLHKETILNVSIYTTEESLKQAVSQLTIELERLLTCKVIITNSPFNNNEDVYSINENCKFVTEYDKLANKKNNNVNEKTTETTVSPFESKKIKLIEFIKELEEATSNPSFIEKVPEKVRKLKLDKLNHYKEELNQLIKKEKELLD